MTDLAARRSGGGQWLTWQQAGRGGQWLTCSVSWSGGQWLWHGSKQVGGGGQWLWLVLSKQVEGQWLWPGSKKVVGGGGGGNDWDSQQAGRGAMTVTWQQEGRGGAMTVTCSASRLGGNDWPCSKQVVEGALAFVTACVTVLTYLSFTLFYAWTSAQVCDWREDDYVSCQVRHLTSVQKNASVLPLPSANWHTIKNESLWNMQWMVPWGMWESISISLVSQNFIYM